MIRETKRIKRNRDKQEYRSYLNYHKMAKKIQLKKFKEIDENIALSDAQRVIAKQELGRKIDRKPTFSEWKKLKLAQIARTIETFSDNIKVPENQEGLEWEDK